jgi:hypothetical protein
MAVTVPMIEPISTGVARFMQRSAHLLGLDASVHIAGSLDRARVRGRGRILGRAWPSPTTGSIQGTPLHWAEGR